MFCSNCGHKFNDMRAAFCPECGKKRSVASTPSVQNENLSRTDFDPVYTTVNSSSTRYNSTNSSIRPSISNSKLNSKQKLGIAISILVITAVIVAMILILNRSGGLSGTWVLQDSYERYPISIHFGGNRFTTTHYETEHGSVFQAGRQGELELASLWHVSLPWGRNDSALREFQGYLDVQRRHLQGGWVTVTESYYRVALQGTYSITEDTIELLFSDGSIQTHNISQTANTLNFGHAFRFIRR